MSWRSRFGNGSVEMLVAKATISGEAAERWDRDEKRAVLVS